MIDTVLISLIIAAAVLWNIGLWKGESKGYTWVSGMALWGYVIVNSLEELGGGP